MFEVDSAGGTQPGLGVLPDVDQQAFSYLAVCVDAAVQDLRSFFENTLLDILFELDHALPEEPTVTAAADKDRTIFGRSLE